MTGSGTDYRIPADSPWAGAWKIAAAVAVLGLAGAGAGFATDPRRFAFSWLFAFTTFLTIALGAIFFVVVQHLTAASWSVAVRRTAEFFAAPMPVFVLLFLPLLGGLGHLYEWAGPHGASEEQDQARDPEEHTSLLGASPASAQEPIDDEDEPQQIQLPPGVGGTEPGLDPHAPAHQLHEDLLEHKGHWLAVPYWLIRALVYFLIWIGIALFYWRHSVAQDESRDPHLTATMQRFAPPAAILFALSLTFAHFDWVMALEPTWYSTIYGVYIFAGAAVSIYALVTVVTLSMRASGLLGDAVTIGHFHDLGKMTFGFIVFWAYIGFSQMMLIWYANIPEEIVYYHARWHAHGWKELSLLLVFGHFALPFLYLISRSFKRRLALLGFGASWMLVMHAVDIYWFVMPSYDGGGLAPHWLDLACLLAVGGVYVGTALYLMTRYPLIPVGDPRLSRSLHHEVI